MSTRRAKIFHLVEATQVGVRQHVVSLLGHLSTAKYELTLGYARRRADALFHAALPALAARGVHLVEVDMQRQISLKPDLIALRQILALLRQQRYDIVHTHSAKAGFLGRLAAHRVRVPVVIHRPAAWSFLATPSNVLRAVYRQLERMAARWTDAIIAVSQHEVNLARQHRIAPDVKLVHIPNGIAPLPPVGRERRREIHTRWGVPASAVIIGSVLRFTWQKDPLGHVATLADVLRNHADAYAVLVGDGPEWPLVQRDIERRHLTGRILLPGFSANVAELLASFDAFVLASRYEGCSYAVLEALAAGLPVVVTSGSSAELVRDGIEGLVVPHGDRSRLSDALATLVEKPDLRERYGQNARRRAQDFSLTRQVQLTEALYDRLLEEKGSSIAHDRERMTPGDDARLTPRL